MNNFDFKLNEHAVGIILKELVRRALTIIRNERFAFEATAKNGYGEEEMNDLFTTADTKAQAIYEKSLRECFPDFGIIGEESLNKKCEIVGRDIYFTVDPLDGTRAFVRKQSHGISTMISLVVDTEVVSAWIGDVNTLEVYGYRPNTNSVHRISAFDVSQHLNDINRKIDIKESFLLRRNFPKNTSELEDKTNKLFKDIHIDGGSIGTWFSRLWKGEMNVLLLDPSFETPWDSTPIYGISKKLGFVFLKPDESGEKWMEYDSGLTKEIYKREFPTLVIHKDILNDFLSLF